MSRKQAAAQYNMWLHAVNETLFTYLVNGYTKRGPLLAGFLARTCKELRLALLAVRGVVVSVDRVGVDDDFSPTLDYRVRLTYGDTSPPPFLLRALVTSDGDGPIRDANGQLNHFCIDDAKESLWTPEDPKKHMEALVKASPNCIFERVELFHLFTKPILMTLGDLFEEFANVNLQQSTRYEYRWNSLLTEVDEDGDPTPPLIDWKKKMMDAENGCGIETINFTAQIPGEDLEDWKAHFDFPEGFVFADLENVTFGRDVPQYVADQVLDRAPSIKHLGIAMPRNIYLSEGDLAFTTMPSARALAMALQKVTWLEVKAGDVPVSDILAYLLAVRDMGGEHGLFALTRLNVNTYLASENVQIINLVWPLLSMSPALRLCSLEAIHMKAEAIADIFDRLNPLYSAETSRLQVFLRLHSLNATTDWHVSGLVRVLADFRLGCIHTRILVRDSSQPHITSPKLILLE